MDLFEETVIAICGHSHVKWLKHFIDNDEVDELGKINENFGIYMENISVKFLGFPGATIGRLKANTTKLTNLKPNVIILIIGGNDLDRDTGDPCQIAIDVFEYALSLISQSTKFVCIGQVIERATNTRHIGNKIECYNQRLRSLCKNVPNIRFWEHDRINKSC